MYQAALIGVMIILYTSLIHFCTRKCAMSQELMGVTRKLIGVTHVITPL